MQDVVAVSPLTTNACVTCHETFSYYRLTTTYSYVSTICEVTSSISLGEMVGQGEVGWYHPRVK